MTTKAVIVPNIADLRKRFYVSGYDKGDWDVSSEYAETPEIALAQAVRRYAGTSFDPAEVDPEWDAALVDGEVFFRRNILEAS